MEYIKVRSVDDNISRNSFQWRDDLLNVIALHTSWVLVHIMMCERFLFKTRHNCRNTDCLRVCRASVDSFLVVKLQFYVLGGDGVYSTPLEVYLH